MHRLVTKAAGSEKERLALGVWAQGRLALCDARACEEKEKDDAGLAPARACEQPRADATPAANGHAHVQPGERPHVDAHGALLAMVSQRFRAHKRQRRKMVFVYALDATLLRDGAPVCELEGRVQIR